MTTYRLVTRQSPAGWYRGAVTDLADRLDAIEGRLRHHSRMPVGSGLTEPDPVSHERWDAGQVWAHMAEFVHYWLYEARQVVERFAGEPVAFGRVKTDPDRIAAIAAGRRKPIAALAEQTLTGLDDVRHFMRDLTDRQRRAKGLHQTLGEMGVPAIVDRFLVSHLEEHLDQLDSLLEQEAAAG
jgi:hypothetical protein